VREGAIESYVILLRGVMPTGSNKVLMAPLRAALEAAGLERVRTYIQSGNVLAASSLGRSRLEALVHDVIAERLGGDIVVLARTAGEFRSILASAPFGDADPARRYFTLLAAEPEARAVEAFLAPGHAPDRVTVIGDVVYLLCATRYSDVKVGNNFIERKLRVAATTRNHNTMSRLAELSAGT
jgi:uncharacterized protein (DUF1697 family)